MPDPTYHADLDRAAAFLRDASSILFITGAGISADSGMPTYRGVGGIYDDAETEDGMAIEVALSGAMLEARPEVTWKYLMQIADACRGCVHNRGHEVIAEMERRFDRVWTLTQNVDGFHRAAGAENVIDIHGDLHDVFCRTCGWHTAFDLDDAASLGDAMPPRCPECNAVVRPDVVLFGEMLPEPKLDQLRAELIRGFDAVVSVGTSSLFHYISEPVLAAVSEGRPTIEINPAETDVSPYVTVRLPLRAAQALDSIWSRID